MYYIHQGYKARQPSSFSNDFRFNTCMCTWIFLFLSPSASDGQHLYIHPVNAKCLIKVNSHTHTVYTLDIIPTCTLMMIITYMYVHVMGDSSFVIAIVGVWRSGEQSR